MASKKKVVFVFLSFLFFFCVTRFINVCILCLAIYLRSIPHKLPRYIKVPKGKEKPLPKKFDWRDKKVIAEVRNQQTVSPGVLLSWFSSTAQRQFQQVHCRAQWRKGKDQHCLKALGALTQVWLVEHIQSNVQSGIRQSLTKKIHISQ